MNIIPTLENGIYKIVEVMAKASVRYTYAKEAEKQNIEAEMEEDTIWDAHRQPYAEPTPEEIEAQKAEEGERTKRDFIARFTIQYAENIPPAEAKAKATALYETLKEELRTSERGKILRMY